MILKKSLVLVSMTLLFPAAAAHAQAPGEKTTIPPNSIQSFNDTASRVDLDSLYQDRSENRPNGVWIAQAQPVTDEQLEQTRENLSEIKMQLDQRTQVLQAEWEALKKEEAELDRISRGGTLQGSKLNKYRKRQAEFNQRVMQYNEDSEQLRQDIEAYETAVKNMNAAQQEAMQGQQLDALAVALGKIDLPPPSALDNPEEIQNLADLLQQKRAELEAEYTALQEERQRIIDESREGGESGASVEAIEQEVYQVDEKINALAKRRKLFNNAVRSVNAMLRQNIQLLPEP